MKDLFSNYSYSMVKMYVNQFAISIFGAVLAMATTAAANDTLSIIVSIFAILFYLFLIYTMTWEIGAKDRISYDVGKKPKRPHTGLLLSLFANVPNLLLALCYLVAFPSMMTQRWAGNFAAVIRVITILTEGMYLGLITSIQVGSHQLNYFWWTYFVITIPAMLTAWLSYYLGFKNVKFTSLFDYKDMSKPKTKG